MVNDWKIRPLEEIADELTVGFVGSMTGEYVNVGIPFLRSQNVESLRINLSDVKYISPAFHKKIRKSALKPGDVVIVRTGKPGTCAVIPDWLTDANCSELMPAYLAYYVNSAAAHHISSHLVGAVQQHFNVGAARRILIPLPSLAEQARIVHILGSLDKKIEVNRNTNETLEAIARTLFNSWFVNFDPVRAKAEGRDTCLPDHIARHFPASFEDSEMGEIPAGWKVAGLDKLGTFLNGLALQKYPPTGPESLPAIKIAQLRAGNADGADRVGVDIPAPYKVADGDVLFSWSGSLECVVWTAGPGALNQHLFRVTSEFYPKWFYLQWIVHHLPEFRRIAAAKATTMGHIQRHHLAQALVLIPPKILVDAMSSYFEPILNMRITRML